MLGARRGLTVRSVCFVHKLLQDEKCYVSIGQCVQNSQNERETKKNDLLSLLLHLR